MLILIAGLSVTYYVDADEYLDFVNTAGVRIVIQNRRDPIFPDTSGYSMPSGYHSVASIRKVARNFVSFHFSENAHFLFIDEKQTSIK